ncbi:transporter substrate-binding domain-containing protein [Methanococcoides burtonii]|uniref:transporter substrate-binding domain-containing protein n=1 Tax=Methanococcoides burtonii TaxID=29291 RepID=UPI00064E6369
MKYITPDFLNIRSRHLFKIFSIIILISIFIVPTQASERTVIVGVNDFKPYAFMDENGKINGFCYEVFNEIAKSGM